VRDHLYSSDHCAEVKRLDQMQIDTYAQQGRFTGERFRPEENKIGITPSTRKNVCSSLIFPAQYFPQPTGELTEPK
jgi:hypothetical protein